MTRALHVSGCACCRLNITFSYNIPAVGEERAKRIAATQEAVLRV